MKQSKDYALDEVNVSFLDKSKNSLPLVISPRYDDSLEFICNWLQDNQSWVDEQMLRFGAVLVRGFQVTDALDFERATLALQPKLSDEYRGTSPRSLMKGTRYSFSAADVPVNYPIAQHLEMSFLKAPPRNLYFGCLKESKVAGGETSLCDFRKVYKDLSPALREKLASKKVSYTRKQKKIGDRFTYDVGAMVSWMELFDTTEKDKVREICEHENAPPFEWVGPNKDTFLQKWIDEPFQIHPDTGELVWFNHSQVFHWTTFSAELWFAFCRVKDFRLFIHFLLVSIFNVIMYGLLGYEMALNTTFGDGSPILAQEMQEIRSAIHKNMIFSRWQKGDILCIDNFSTSHGRQPTFDKGRKVVVAWSQPHNKAALPAAQESLDNEQKCTTDCIHDKWTALPHLSATTPESSLTESEAAIQKAAVFKMQGRKQSNHKRFASCPNMIAPDSDFWKKLK